MKSASCVAGWVLSSSLSLFHAGCGGKVVVGLPGDGGAGAGTSTSSSTSNGTTSTAASTTSTSVTSTTATASVTSGNQVCQPGESMTYTCDCGGEGYAQCYPDGSGWDYQGCDCPPCVSCADYITNGEGTPCPDSQALYDTLVECVCSGACGPVCGATLCQGEQDDACIACIQDPDAGCGKEFDACANDQ